MNQRELAELVGVIAHHQVSLHERSLAFPTLMAALAYEVVFRVSIAELFPALSESIRMNVEARLATMEKLLENSTAKGRAAHVIARKLEWLWMRKNPQTVESLE